MCWARDDDTDGLDNETAATTNTMIKLYEPTSNARNELNLSHCGVDSLIVLVVSRIGLSRISERFRHFRLRAIDLLRSFRWWIVRAHSGTRSDDAHSNKKKLLLVSIVNKKFVSTQIKATHKFSLHKPPPPPLPLHRRIFFAANRPLGIANADAAWPTVCVGGFRFTNQRTEMAHAK